MNERMTQMVINTVGALSGNYVFYAKLPVGMTLTHVSAVGSNAHDATVMIGDSGDTDQAIGATAIGDSGAPAEIEFADLSEAHFVAGDVLVVTVDYDGDGGTAIQNLQIVLTFLVG